MSSEIRIRVKPHVKELLESIKEEHGFSINFQVNFAIFKYLVLDLKIPLWKLQTEQKAHYETDNKLPEDMCEVVFKSDGSVDINKLPEDTSEFKTKVMRELDRR